MARQKKIVAARQKRRLGEQTRLVVDGPSPEHELVMQGRLPGQAPEIDPVVYLTDCDPSAFPRGSFVDVEIVGAEGYDLIARPLEPHERRGASPRGPKRRAPRRAKPGAPVLHYEVGS